MNCAFVALRRKPLTVVGPPGDMLCAGIIEGRERPCIQVTERKMLDDCGTHHSGLRCLWEARLLQPQNPFDALGASRECCSAFPLPALCYFNGCCSGERLAFNVVPRVFPLSCHCCDPVFVFGPAQQAYFKSCSTKCGSNYNCTHSLHCCTMPWSRVTRGAMHSPANGTDHVISAKWNSQTCHESKTVQAVGLKWISSTKNMLYVSYQQRK